MTDDRCDDYCCNHGCHQGKHCPARTTHTPHNPYFVIAVISTAAALVLALLT